MTGINIEIARIEEREEAREKRLGNVEGILYGNGSPGVVRKIDRLVMLAKILVALGILNVTGTAASNIKPLIAAIIGM